MDKEEPFHNLNPFDPDKEYDIRVKVTDRRRLWDYVAEKMYSKNEDGSYKEFVPGATILEVSWRNDSAKLKEVLDEMEKILVANGRIR